MTRYKRRLFGFTACNIGYRACNRGFDIVAADRACRISVGGIGAVLGKIVYILKAYNLITLVSVFGAGNDYIAVIKLFVRIF